MRYFLFLTFLFTVYLSSGQSPSGYNIRFKVDGWKDTTAYLGHYYGEQTYLKDTARVNSKGEFTFDGKKDLAPGVYFLVVNRNKIFDLIVGKEQHFSLETKSEDYLKYMKVTGDMDNKLFFENMSFNVERHKEAEPFLKIIQDSTLTEDQKKASRENFSKINDKVVAYQESIISKYPNTLTAIIFKSNIAVPIPDPPKKQDGTIDSTFQLRWYREHFFDNFDLGNEAMLRMPRPVYGEKINEYLDKLFAPQADSLIKAIDNVLTRAKKTQETYKYAFITIMRKYQEPEIMGLDAIYVHLNDKYVANGQMDFWVNAPLKKNIKEYADRLRSSLIGKTGANLIMQDANFKARSMYDLKNKYTILFIFDPDCGHCRKETPKLVDFYTKNKTKFDVEVFAVSADTSMAKMRDYIKEMKTKWITVNGPRTYVGPYGDLYDASTTPSLYILDEKKKIIGKKVPIEKLEDFLTHYERFQKVQKAKG